MLWLISLLLSISLLISLTVGDMRELFHNPSVENGMINEDIMDKISFYGDDNIFEDNYDTNINMDDTKPIFEFDKPEFQKQLLEALSRVKYIENINNNEAFINNKNFCPNHDVALINNNNNNNINLENNQKISKENVDTNLNYLSYCSNNNNNNNNNNDSNIVIKSNNNLVTNVYDVTHNIINNVQTSIAGVNNNNNNNNNIKNGISSDRNGAVFGNYDSNYLDDYNNNDKNNDISIQLVSSNNNNVINNDNALKNNQKNITNTKENEIQDKPTLNIKTKRNLQYNTTNIDADINNNNTLNYVDDFDNDIKQSIKVKSKTKNRLSLDNKKSDIIDKNDNINDKLEMDGSNKIDEEHNYPCQKYRKRRKEEDNKINNNNNDENNMINVIDLVNKDKQVRNEEKYQIKNYQKDIVDVVTNNPTINNIEKVKNNEIQGIIDVSIINQGTPSISSIEIAELSTGLPLNNVDWPKREIRRTTLSNLDKSPAIIITKNFEKRGDEKYYNKIPDKNSIVGITVMPTHKNTTALSYEDDRSLVPFRQINKFVNNLLTLVNNQYLLRKEFGLCKRFIKPFYVDKTINDKLMSGIIQCKDSSTDQSCCQMLPELKEFVEWLLI